MADSPAEPFGYAYRHKAAVEDQRQAFPGEEPDYLWQMVKGTKHLVSTMAMKHLETVVLYSAPQPEPAALLENRDANEAARATMVALGYTYHGGERWKPPLGKAPDFDLIDSLRAERDALQAALTASMSKCQGIPDSRCNYLAHCYGPCNKCGRQHDAGRARTEGSDGASVDADRAAN